MSCWLCGVEPISLLDVTAFHDSEPRYLAVWAVRPTDNHEHSTRPPTPEELDDEYMAILARRGDGA